MNTTIQTPDFEAIKTRQQAAWAAGDYGHVGVLLQVVGESLCEAVDLRSRDLVLDVAAGNGNASLAAARRHANVLATDYVPELLEQTTRRAKTDGLTIETRVADVEKLPFEDGTFDVVLSTFGAMFAPDQVRTAAEMARVTKSGGRIAMANWTPESPIGELFRLLGRFLPPPAGLQPPSAWGVESRLAELFAGTAKSSRVERRHFRFCFRSPEHWIDVFRTWYGPVNKAFAALDEPGQKALHAALLELLERHNIDQHGALTMPSEYLEVVIERA